MVNRVESADATRELPDVEDGRAGMLGVGTRPLQALALFQACVHDACVGRRQGVDFGHDVSRIPVLPGGVRCIRIEGAAFQQAEGQLAGDLPIGERLAQRLDGFMHHLDAALGVGEGAALLGKRDAGQQHVGIGAGLGWEDFLQNQKIHCLQTLADVGCIRVGHDRVFAEDVQGVDLALQDVGDHLSDGHAGGRRKTEDGGRVVRHRSSVVRL